MRDPLRRQGQVGIATIDRKERRTLNGGCAPSCAIIARSGDCERSSSPEPGCVLLGADP
jgi:hypothetical protein